MCINLNSRWFNVKIWAFLGFKFRNGVTCSINADSLLLINPSPLLPDNPGRHTRVGLLTTSQNLCTWNLHLHIDHTLEEFFFFLVLFYNYIFNFKMGTNCHVLLYKPTVLIFVYSNNMTATQFKENTKSVSLPTGLNSYFSNIGTKVVSKEVWLSLSNKYHGFLPFNVTQQKKSFLQTPKLSPHGQSCLSAVLKLHCVNDQ